MFLQKTFYFILIAYSFNACSSFSSYRDLTDKEKIKFLEHELYVLANSKLYKDLDESIKFYNQTEEKNATEIRKMLAIKTIGMAVGIYLLIEENVIRGNVKVSAIQSLQRFEIMYTKSKDVQLIYYLNDYVMNLFKMLKKHK